MIIGLLLPLAVISAATDHIKKKTRKRKYKRKVPRF